MTPTYDIYIGDLCNGRRSRPHPLGSGHLPGHRSVPQTHSTGGQSANGDGEHGFVKDARRLVMWGEVEEGRYGMGRKGSEGMKGRGGEDEHGIVKYERRLVI